MGTSRNGTNYTADDQDHPKEVTFDNGRVVTIAYENGNPYLQVGLIEKEKPMNRKEAIKAAILHLNSYAEKGDELLKTQISDVVKGLSRTRKAKSKPATETPAPAAAAN